MKLHCQLGSLQELLPLVFFLLRKMYWQASVILVLVSSCFSNVIGANIPDYIHICRRSDPEVEKCIMNSIEMLRPQLKNGIPELDVPPLEPLFLPLVKVSDEGSNFHALGKNIKAHGASNFEMTKLKLDTATDTRLVLQVGLNFPWLEIEGDYEVNARLLSLPINGNGQIHVNTTNTKADMIVYGQVRKKGNHNYIRFTKLDMGLKIDDYSVRLDNLFNDKVLEEATNRLLNENKKQIMESIHPIITRTAIENILDISNKVAKNQPYDLLFPE